MSLDDTHPQGRSLHCGDHESHPAHVWPWLPERWPMWCPGSDPSPAVSVLATMPTTRELPREEPDMSDTPGPVDPDLMISDAELRSLADALRYGEPRQAVVARIEELIETNPRVATVEVSSTLEVSELAGRFVQFHRYAGSAASSSKDAPVWVRDDEVVVIEALASGSVVQLSCGARLDLQESAEAVLAALGHIEPEPLDEIGDDSQEHYT